MTSQEQAPDEEPAISPAPLADIVKAFRQQALWCAELGSPFTSRVVDLIADDLERGGPSRAVVSDFIGEPLGAALPLRFAGGLVTLVQTGQEPALEKYYPPNNGRTASGTFVRTLIDTVKRNQGFLNAFAKLTVQTNEVGRSACLLGGFLEIAKLTAAPLHLYELGASAGLNLAWDHYGYRLGDARWGDQEACVLLAPEWHGGLPALDERPQILSRHGCDLRPINLHDPGFQRQAEAYIWPDQTERLERFRAAAEVTRRLNISIERADALEWLQSHLTAPAPDGVRVFFHSIFWQYLSKDAQSAVVSAFERAGQEATNSAPLAWLRMEPDGAIGPPLVELTLWPGGQTYRLAVCHPHGRIVKWGTD